MENVHSSNRRVVKVVRWIARVLSALIIFVMLFFVIGEGINGDTSPQDRPISILTVIQLILAAIELIGLGIAWKWELTGASITLPTWIVKAIINPRTVMTPLILVPITALMFLACWWWSRSPRPKVSSD